MSEDVVREEIDVATEEVKETKEIGLDDLKSKLDSVLEDSNKKSALIRKLSNKLESLEEQLKAPKEKTNDKTQIEASEIEKRIKERESSLEQRHQKRAKLYGISEALEDAGLKKDKARRFAKLIEMEEGKNLQVALDDFDDYTLVGFKTSDGEVISTNKWMQEYLNSDKGSAFRPVSKGPTPPISRNGVEGQGARKKVSAIEFSKLMQGASRDERKTLAEKYEIVD